MSGFRVWLVVLLAAGAAWVWWRVGQSGGERLTTFACATELLLLRFTDGVPEEWLGGANEAVVTAAFRVSDSGAPESVTVTGPTDAIRSQVRAPGLKRAASVRAAGDVRCGCDICWKW